MLRALTTAATGMIAQQNNLDVISHNIANLSTYGYKKVRAEFQDLLSQVHRTPGAQMGQGTYQPVGIEVGLGVKTSATTRIFTPGTMQSTDRQLDMAIAGDGFFQITMDDGSIAYTRDGAWQMDANGQLVTSDGYQLQPPITIPINAKDITVSQAGIVSCSTGTNSEQTQLGQIQLVKFQNPSGLLAIGHNLYRETQASGTPLQGTAGEEGYGTIEQCFIEGSNVQTVEELIGLIKTERAYESNSKVITAGSDILKQTNQIV